MEAVEVSLTGLLSFVLYFGISLVMLLVFKFVYALVTPHDECHGLEMVVASKRRS